MSNYKEFLKKSRSHIIGVDMQFSFDKAVKEVRANYRNFGADMDHKAVSKQSQWPYLETVKNPKLDHIDQQIALSSLRITKIEWSAVDTITSLRFSFNNNTVSP